MKRLNKCFALIMFLLIGLFLFCLVFPPSLSIISSQKTVLFAEGKNWFADFFNVLRYISDDDGYYFSKINEFDGHSGFPLSIAILYPFTQLIDYREMSLEGCYMSKTAVFSCVAYLTVMVSLFWDSLNRLCDKFRVRKFNLLIFLFSSVFIFSLERANFVFLSATLISYFLVYYDSQSLRLRSFALICLCIAATLKGYPVFFGLLLLKEKRYKDILFCVVFTLIIVFVPFVFMERGFENLSKMIQNTGVNSASYIHNYNYMFGLHKFVYLGTLAAHLPDSSIDLVIKITRIIELLLGFLTFIFVLLDNRIHRQLLLIACTVLLMPINSGFYCALYMFPVILVFFSNREVERADWILMLLLCLVINPFQIILPYKQVQFYMTPMLSNAAIISIWFLLLLSSVSKLKNFKIRQLL